FFGSFGFYGALGLPFVMLIAFLLFRKRKKTLDSDFIGTKQRKANRKARKRLKDAEKALKAGDHKQYYAEIFKALYGYLGDKLNIPGSQLSKLVIGEKLSNAGVKPETIESLIKTLDACEMARFASVEGKEHQAFFRETVSLIAQLENELSV
ncbi:MAG TPA: hypothetical protein VJ911_01200, partial [Cryomorphaceae bacterium]|nr:hypothetical protein [Cryomorphaceae bacterium]